MEGMVILTASDAYEYAYEENDASEVGDNALPFSSFTQALLLGLSSGEADLDGDGRIAVDELFHARKVLSETNSAQHPKFFALATDRIYLASRVGGSRLTSSEEPARQATHLSIWAMTTMIQPCSPQPSEHIGVWPCICFSVSRVRRNGWH